MESQIFDETALIEARKAILNAESSAKVSLMMTQDIGLYGAQNGMFDQPDAHLEDREYLKSLLKTQGVSHLLLISKLRSVAKFQLYNSSEGSGMLEGLGFYVDDMINLRRIDTQDGARGMLAPFAYVRVRLIDAATLDVMGEASSKQSIIMAQPSVESSGMQLFQAQTSADKVRHMRTLLESAMAEVMPRLLKR